MGCLFSKNEPLILPPSRRHRPMYTLVFAGESGVGKTRLFNALVPVRREINAATPGVDFATLEDGDTLYHMRDLSGLDKHLPVAGDYLSVCDGAFLVFDMTNMASFSKIPKWLELLSKRAACVLVGTRADGKREVDESTIRVAMAQYGISSYTACDALNSMAIARIMAYMRLSLVSREDGVAIV